ncbi:MAG TPA: sigma-54 dependent transcriptional regulator [Geopsychrobacteraceae bacterium]
MEKIRIGRITAKTRSNVLIQGEEGCGKKLFGRAIHQTSPMAAKPFIHQNCAGISEKDLQTELFGTNKPDRRPGSLEQANGGVLFLDEVAAMPLDLQRQLLAILQNGQFQRPGEKQVRPLEVRIIATTSRDLLQEIAFNGTFLSDLYDHLNVFNLQLPALRERPEDIPLLASSYLKKININNQTNKQLSTEALTALCSHSWPGNVRELINVLERAFYLSLDETTIQLSHLPTTLSQGLGRQQPKPQPHESNFAPENCSEQQELEHAIRASNYNMSKAAKRLGISRSTLYRKIGKYNIKLTAGIVKS